MPLSASQEATSIVSHVLVGIIGPAGSPRTVSLAASSFSASIPPLSTKNKVGRKLHSVRADSIHQGIIRYPVFWP